MYKKYDKCAVQDCTNKHEAHGYCVKHYKRWRKTGSPLSESRYDKRSYALVGIDIRVPLGVGAKDGYALLSQNDAWAAELKWYLGKNGYPTTRLSGKLVTMHRLILSFPNKEVDHINRNKCDNRRHNLRLVDRSTNSFNTGLRSINTSGYKGVSYNKNARKYSAQITINGKRNYLGLFITPEEAYEAYIKAAP